MEPRAAAPSPEELRMRREVLALREALESAQFAHEQRLAELAAARRTETDELQSTIRRLREVLEETRAAHAQAQEELRRRMAAENRELQAALAAARERFEAARLEAGDAHRLALLAEQRLRAELEETVRQLREALDGRQ